MKSLEIVNELLQDVECSLLLAKSESKLKENMVTRKLSKRMYDLAQVAKDLEVLEILKKYIPENWNGFQIIMSDKKTKWEDWKKVEQWLEENEWWKD